MAPWANEAGWAELLATLTLGFVSLTLLCVGAGYLTERLMRRRRIWDVRLKRGQLRREIIGNAVFFLVFLPAITSALATNAIVFNGRGWGAEVLTFVVCWIAFQHLYYFMHRAMHWRPLYRLHKWHHDSLVTTAWTGFSMSAGEAAGWTLCYLAPALVLSRLGLFGFYGFAVFIVANWYSNIVGHVNAECLPAFFGRRFMGAATGTVIFHSLHHARFDGHYGFGTPLQDRLFGTEFEDWPALHRKVIDGTPLGSLRERGTPDKA